MLYFIVCRDVWRSGAIGLVILGSQVQCPAVPCCTFAWVTGQLADAPTCGLVSLQTGQLAD